MNSNPRPKAKGKEPSTDAPQDEHRMKRVGATWNELIDQPDAINETLEAEKPHIKEIATSLLERDINRFLIVGCGDSWIVGQGVRSAFENLLQFPFESIQAFDFARYFNAPLGRRTAVLGISSSGTTKAVLEALKQAKEKGAYTIGMSNTIDSPLLTMFENNILVHATRIGWPTQASTASMAALLQLAIDLSKLRKSHESNLIAAIESELTNIPDKISKIIKLADKPIQSIANEWYKARYILLCGAGSNFAPAGFGAAKITELSPVRGIAILMEEFHHYRSIKPGDPLILFAPDRQSFDRAIDTAEVAVYDGGNVFAITSEDNRAVGEIAQSSLVLPNVHDYLKPLCYSIPAQLFAYYFAIAKFNHSLGFEPAFKLSVSNH